MKTKIFPSPDGRSYFFPLAPIKHAVNAFLFSRPRSNRKANYELTGADGRRCSKPRACSPAHARRPPYFRVARENRGRRELSRHMLFVPIMRWLTRRTHFVASASERRIFRTTNTSAANKQAMLVQCKEFLCQKHFKNMTDVYDRPQPKGEIMQTL